MKRKVNIIVVFNQAKSHVLMCKRKKPPYKNHFNFVGGKIEPNENHLSAAYRELQEETGISEQQITLSHLMDFTYFQEDTLLETYVGTLNETVTLKGEENPLFWIPLTTDFNNTHIFAGNGNINHILKYLSDCDQSYNPDH